MPKITLLTPTFNSAKTIVDTLESVVAQTINNPSSSVLQNLEYIIIDGASKDKTASIVQDYINKYPSLNIRFISEPDNGIYDAMNKGIKMATGEIVGILNSDDFYSGDDVLNKICEMFETDPDIDAVYGDLMYVNNNDTSEQTRYWKAGEYEEKKLNYGWIIPHPTLFVRKNVYEKSDKIFDISFSLAADYEFILRQLKINKIKVKYLPETLVSMRDGGASASGLKQRIKGWQELRKAWKINNLKIPSFFIFRRVFNKISQFIHKN